MITKQKLMNIKFFNVALGIVLTATTLGASAQKTYTEGVVTYNTSMQGNPIEAKHYFTADSAAIAFSAGPASIKVLSDAKQSYMAVLVDVPVASIKKAAIATPSEIETAMNALPTFTFTPTTETKQISGFNCKKVIAKDNKDGKTYDVWITNDVSLPQTAISRFYRTIGGFPIQYTSFQQGQTAEVTVKSITEGKAPKGTFGIPADFDKITMDDLKAMSGGGN